MKQKLKYLLLATFVIVTVGVCSSREVFAEAGAVQTNGRVTFYDETSTTPSGTTEPSGTTDQTYPKTSGNEEVPVAKPVGKLPSTGELIAKSLTISGSILLAVAILFVLLKKKRKAE
ncbi:MULTISPECIES: LPXTG cell wall anchor domain-containing protein [unclassified Enterococcus]|uniref:LPXTG cell wall anchor domain-containing protein n=1 Tax=unclassified Enterococcus TaxID=2608891 RepID=UPI001CE051B2|nr:MULTISPECIES: LPXTG cell wall anchor domain-containing protein [unclassified Enterococcus]MCA5013655.1 LPXTG cell wall anchor domain-containing protein [Enterococcus sp. S23]MCA5016905.1 LPXTG cell wall anchor domain-containing protein [Enterococcus sp. S22(2020)]